MHRERIALVLAVLTGAVALLGMRRYLERRETEIAGGAEAAAWVVAARDLPQGTALDPATDLRVASFPRRTSPSSAVEAESLSLLSGRPLLRARRAGEPILWLDVPEAGRELADAVPVGQRAYALSLTRAGALAGLLNPRDRVDVIGIFPVEASGDAPPQRAARLLLPNVTVLAVGARAAGDEAPEGDDAGATVTLAVKPAEAQLLALAEREGDLALVLRHPEDLEDPQPGSAIDIRSEHLANPGGVREIQLERRARIEIYKEGLPQPGSR